MPGVETSAKAECDAHAAELAEQSMMWAYALTPGDMAVAVRASGSEPGPFVKQAPVVAGFYIIEAPDLDTAIAIAGTNPAVDGVGGVEVRPVHSGGAVR